MRIGRIPYINCYPVYGAIDRGIVALDATLVDGVPSVLNRRMANGELDVSVVSAVEYARDAERYLLLPDLAISCDGAVRSVMLFSRHPAHDLGGRKVVVSRSSMSSVALLKLLFRDVWHASPVFVPGDAEITDLSLDDGDHDARLVIGDAALLLGSRLAGSHNGGGGSYSHAYDLGAEWKRWTGLPFVFAVWVARRAVPASEALRAHARLIESRDWGVRHLGVLAAQAAHATGIARTVCGEFLAGLDYRLTYSHLAGLTDFFRRLAEAGDVPNGTLAFLPAA